MRIAALVAVAALAAVAPQRAHADPDHNPCASPLVDPTVTPVRDVELDAQRAACVRQEVFARALGHALVDTPGFHGVLGGHLTFGGRMVLRERYELSAQLRIFEHTFVQNAVNKVNHTAFGPVIVGGAATHTFPDGTVGALALQLELPYTRDPMDTFHTSGQLAGLVTTRLSHALVLHGRFGGLAMHASSLAGSTNRFAVRAGSDLVWRARSCFAVLAGADVSAGWRDGFDHVLARAGVHWKFHAADWRLRGGVGVPLGGDERTNAVLEIAIIHGM